MAKTLYLVFALTAFVAGATAYKYTPCGGRCGGYRPPCEKGTRCYYGVCKAKNLGLGEKCSKCKECKRPYLCKNGICSQESPQACGGQCNTGAFPNKCSGGAVCKDKKCVKPMQGLGDSCKDPCETCKAPYICDKKKGVCSQKPAQGCGGECNTGGLPNKCSDGSICKGKKCVKPMQSLGQSCKEKCETCKKPFICSEKGVCVRDLVGCGGSCKGGRRCEAGLHCRGGTCKKTNVPGGGECSSCKTCRYGYKCVDGKCSRPLSQCGGPCGGYSRKKCAAGLVCQRSRCAKLVGANETCGGCKKCKSGYYCNSYRKKCVARKH